MDRVNWVVHDCFNAARQLRQASAGSSSMNPSELYSRTRALVDAMLSDAARAGFSSEDARLMAYAVVALLDELVMTKTGPLREHWSAKPLQLVYFQENVAGDNFFTHLDRIRHDPTRVDVLRVFYLALLFGFQGKHRVRGSEVELSDLVESLRSQLGRNLTIPEFLSPDGRAPDAAFLPSASRIPYTWIGVCAVALAVVFYLGLRVSLQDKADALLTWMQTQSS